jgi:putative transcriptional regulator
LSSPKARFPGLTVQKNYPTIRLMVRFKLAEVMARYQIKVKVLAAEMGYTPDAITHLKKSAMPRLSGDAWDKLIKSLRKLSGEEIMPNDLFEYKED